MNFDVIISHLTDGSNVAFALRRHDQNTSQEPNIECYTHHWLHAVLSGYHKFTTYNAATYLAHQLADYEIDEFEDLPAVDYKNSIMEYFNMDLHCDDNSGFEFYSSLYTGESKQVTMMNVGHWNSQDGVLTARGLYPHVTSGFLGQSVDVASMHNPPWQIYNHRYDGTNEYEGITFEVLEEIGKRLNFSYRVRTSANDSMAGIVDAVSKKLVFLGAAPFMPTPAIYQQLDVTFTMPFDHISYAFMYSRPKRLDRPTIIVEPFCYDTWLGIILAVIIMGPLLLCFQRCSAYYAYYQTVTKYRGLFSAQNCSLYVYGSIVQQGGRWLPDAPSGRVLLSFWWLFVMVVVTTYSGNLVATLTLPVNINQMTSLEKLLKAKHLSVVMKSSSPLLQHLQTDLSPQGRMLFKRIQPVANIDNAVLDRVAKGKCVYMDTRPELLVFLKETFEQTGRCRFSLSEDDFFVSPVSFIMSKGTPYLHVINEGLDSINRAGLMSRWRHLHWPKEDSCLGTATREMVNSTVVNVGDVTGSFYFLAIGSSAAAVVIFFELIHYRWKFKRLPFRNMRRRNKLITSGLPIPSNAWTVGAATVKLRTTNVHRLQVTSFRRSGDIILH